MKKAIIMLGIVAVIAGNCRQSNTKVKTENNITTSWADSVFYSNIRSNEKLKLHSIYVDTFMVFSLRDYSWLQLEKNGKVIELYIYDDDWKMVSNLNLRYGNSVEIEWKIDSICTKDEKELLLFREYAVKITIINDTEDIIQLHEKSYTPVSAEEIAVIAPVIKKWTDFYNIDFAQAWLIDSNEDVCFNCPPDATSIYYREFTQKRDTDKRIDVDYSPDKQRYVDLGIAPYYNEEDKKYYFIGWDDCQEIYLIDRKQKHQNMIIWLGVSSLAEAVFWKSNDIFVVVGYDTNYNYASLISRFIYVFDIEKQSKNSYEIMTEIDGDYNSYMYEVYLKEKGIFVE